MVVRCKEHQAMIERADIAITNAGNRHIDKYGRMNGHGFNSRRKALMSRDASLTKHLKECPRCNGGMSI